MNYSYCVSNIIHIFILSICSFTGKFYPGHPMGWQLASPRLQPLRTCFGEWSQVCQWPPSSVAEVVAHHPSYTLGERLAFIWKHPEPSLSMLRAMSPQMPSLTAPGLAPLQFPYKTSPGKSLPGNFQG